MQTSENFETDIQLCQKCATEIPLGTSYFSIVKNLEHTTKDGENNEVEIETEISEEIITLCKQCGDVFNASALITILEHLPIPGTQHRN